MPTAQIRSTRRSLPAGYAGALRALLRRATPRPAVALLIAVAGCGGGDRPTEPAPTPPPGTAVVASIRIPAHDTTRLGEPYRVTVTVLDARGRAVTGRRPSFASITPDVATIDSVGVVTPITEGVATIRASVDTVAAELTLVVHPAPVATLRFPVGGSVTEIALGDTLTVRPEIIDRVGRAVERPARWGSSNPAVATVDSTGRVRALATGSATISVAVEHLVARYVVTVRAYPAPGTLVVRPAALELVPGTVGRLWVNAADSAGGRLPAVRLAFTSSDPGVATVSADGTITARAPGSAVVTTTVNGRSAETVVEVEPSRAGGYRIDFVFHGPLAGEAAFQAAARRAAARWERVIVGALPTQKVDYPAGTCATGAPAISVTTTGLVVLVMTDHLGGSTVGWGGPCAYRNGYGAPAVGVVTLDTAAVRRYAANGGRMLEELLTHEIGHVIGVGTRWTHFGEEWSAPGMRTGPETDWRFVGEHATAASAALGFTAPGAPVPIEIHGGAGTAGSHLRAQPYSPEVMTGWMSGGDAPLTTVTAGLLRDLGYDVQMGGAQPVTAAEMDPSDFGPRLPPGAAGAAGVTLRRERMRLERIDELPWTGPVYVTGSDGRPQAAPRR